MTLTPDVWRACCHNHVSCDFRAQDEVSCTLQHIIWSVMVTFQLPAHIVTVSALTCCWDWAQLIRSYRRDSEGRMWGWRGQMRGTTGQVFDIGECTEGMCSWLMKEVMEIICTAFWECSMFRLFQLFLVYSSTTCTRKLRVQVVIGRVLAHLSLWCRPFLWPLFCTLVFYRLTFHSSS